MTCLALVSDAPDGPLPPEHCGQPMDAVAPVPQFHRHPWSFSLRTLFVVVTVFAVALTLAIAYPEVAIFVVVMGAAVALSAAQVVLPWWFRRRR